MKTEKKGNLYKLSIFLTLCFLVALDLWTKNIAVSSLSLGSAEEFFLPFIDLLLLYNSGIAFGVLDNNNQFQIYGLLIIGTIIVSYILYLAFKETSYKKMLGFSIIAGGALGNIIDRAINGHVTDFLHLKINNFSFFIFNMADAFITIGAILIIYFELKTNSDDAKTN